MARQTGSAASSERLFAEALRLRLEGRTQDAVDRLHAIVGAIPGHARANLALAEMLKDQGRGDDALAAFRRAAEAAPDDASLWSRFVFELRDAGQKGRARKVARQARVTAGARKRLIDIAEGRGAPVEDIAELIRAGQPAQAWALGIRRVENFPEDDHLLNLLGVAALAEDDTVRAEGVLQRALSAAPSSEAAAANLGLALVRQGRGFEAVQLLEPFYRKPGASLNLRVNLASAYLRSERFADAESLTAALIAEAPEDDEVLGIRAEALLGLGRAAQALDLLRSASGRAGFSLQDVLADALSEVEGRDAAMSYVNGLPELGRTTASRLAALLAEWGELDRAAGHARRLAEMDPSDPAPFRLYGLCATWQKDDPLIPAMRAAATSQQLSPLKRGVFALSLAKAAMDIGDDAEAFAALRTGNDAIRGLVGYDVAEDEAIMERIAGLWTGEAIEAAKAGSDGPAPIFIVGLPRSGSTLVETILSRHAAVDAMGETPLVYSAAAQVRTNPDPAAVAEVARQVGGALTPEPPKRVKTDKLLANFLNVGVLAAAFPKARFVETRRDYRDTCLSIYQADLGPRSHPYAMNLEELGRYAVAYDRLMSHWADVLDGRVIRVRYEDLVTDPEAEVPALVEALGLEWDPACLAQDAPARKINTMSVAQARKPISKSSVGRWRRFERELAPLTRILEENGLIRTP